ncbi:MAG: nucleotidyltransferase domain-containing protein [Candidatus Izemoplasmataceae bacterium]
MEVIKRFYENLISLLPNRVIDIIVYGSFIRGDFEPETSDIDFIVFVEGALSEEDIYSIEKLHELYRKEDAHVNLLEGRYLGVQKDKMINGYYVGTSRKGWKKIDELGFDSIETGMILDCYWSYKNQNIINDFLKCDWSLIKKELILQFDDLLNHDLFLKDKGFTNYALITTARSLYTYINQGFISKREATKWLQNQILYFDLDNPLKTLNNIREYINMRGIK